MARLSGYLAGQLANPSYGGMLSQNVQGGMQGIADTMALKRQNQATDSINTMLTNFDPNDKNVLKSIAAVGRQTGQDPLAVQKLIENAQQEQRIKTQFKLQQEAAARAVGADARDIESHNRQMIDAQRNAELRDAAERRAIENHRFSMSSAKYQETLQKRAEDERKWTTAAAGAATKGVEAQTAVLNAAPPEYRAAIQETMEGKAKFDEEMSTYQEAATTRQGFSEEQLSKIEANPALVDAVKAYRLTKEVSPVNAAKTLMESMKTYATASAYRDQTTAKVPSEWEVKAAQEFIDEHIPKTSVPGTGTFGYFADEAVNGQPGFSESLAMKLASERKNNPDFIMTPESVQSLASQMMAQGNEPAEETPSAPPATEAEMISKVMAANPGSSEAEARQFLKDKGYL